MTAGRAASAFWGSRLLVWAAGIGAFAGLGASGDGRSFDPAGVSDRLGSLGNALVAPAVRWDAVWYLGIARHGYRTAREVAFFPLYPLLTRALSELTGSLALAGIAVSVIGALIGVTVIYRLAELELGDGPARAAVLLLCFSPVALFLTAAYTEGLFLALSAGAVAAARRGRWARAGALGGLAALTRSTGILLAVPVAILYLYGPREDRAPDRPRQGLRPCYQVRPDALWALLVPAGAALFAAYLALRGFGWLGSVRAEHAYWQRETINPLLAVPRAFGAAVAQIIGTAPGIAPRFEAQAVEQLAFLLLAAAALVATVRRLPAAYGAYTFVGLVAAASTTATGAPLVSFDRYASVLFPLYLGAGAWACERRLVRPVVLACGLALAYLTARFATWHWVA